MPSHPVYFFYFIGCWNDKSKPCSPPNLVATSIIYIFTADSTGAAPVKISLLVALTGFIFTLHQFWGFFNRYRSKEAVSFFCGSGGLEPHYVCVCVGRMLLQAVDSRVPVSPGCHTQTINRTKFCSSSPSGLSALILLVALLKPSRLCLDHGKRILLPLLSWLLCRLFSLLCDLFVYFREFAINKMIPSV